MTWTFHFFLTAEEFFFSFGLVVAYRFLKIFSAKQPSGTIIVKNQKTFHIKINEDAEVRLNNNNKVLDLDNDERSKEWKAQNNKDFIQEQSGFQGWQ